MTRVAFYAPVKPPDHPIPSGDRLIGANLMTALGLAGFETCLASRFIAYSKRHQSSILAKRKHDAMVAAREAVELLESEPPDLFITYHPYCKAPDWIGPAVSTAFDIPYVTVEAAHTGQGFENGGDLWCHWRREAHHGMRQADLHLCFKPSDRNYLLETFGADTPVHDLPIFIDTQIVPNIRPADLPDFWRPDVPVLSTAAMMRPGKKVENFRLLAEALLPLQGLDWNLIIIGDGPEMPQVRGFFSSFNEDRILFTGGLERDDVLSHLRASGLFVWPGWKEPIGMVYLEAQMLGVPVAAFNSMGVPLVVRDGETGLLAPEGDIDALADNMRNLISHPALRNDLAKAAAHHVTANHSPDAAASVLREVLTPLLAAHKSRR